ncbi:hypothetical protein [Nostoc sp. FACHB-145]|uniref:hypothetical protein n=1 Tax=Nostoc sp. FACHB-145 TaxID=2692836 RepID=UPI0016878848|nr:hypothetical protein [Nostoc sp. FACHB-145]MBD2468819.1 hypothetical protein [Nostoc sp. FACHB-145]
MSSSKSLIENKRGIETLEITDNQVVVKAPIDRVSQAFFQERQAVNLKYDVYNNEVEITDLCFIIYQLKKHSWTLIKTENCEPSETYLNCNDAKILSSVLHTKAIFYSVIDNPINIYYNLYIDGDSKETFNFCNEYNDVDEDFEESDEDEASIEGLYTFHSKLRLVQDSDIKDEFTFVNAFFEEHDVYVPPLNTICESGKTGRKVTLTISGFQHDDFERMDYISVK